MLDTSAPKPVLIPYTGVPVDKIASSTSRLRWTRSSAGGATRTDAPAAIAATSAADSSPVSVTGAGAGSGISWTSWMAGGEDIPTASGHRRTSRASQAGRRVPNRAIRLR